MSVSNASFSFDPSDLPNCTATTFACTNFLASCLGGSDGVVDGSGGGVVGVVDEPVFVAVGVAVGGGVVTLTGSHDWLPVVAAASSSATA